MKFLKKRAYPSQLYIGPFLWKIKFSNKIQYFGDTDPNKRIIRIKKGLSARETFTTYIHEVLHALDFTHKIKLSHNEVYALEKAISELFMDNFL